ncbi:MAG: hypothetical protein J6X70_02185 [Muribaculaceae bacterium]|nr:hypothetical protein [Muribaculaceae bacterium]
MKKLLFILGIAVAMAACGSGEGQSPRSDEAREEGLAAATRLVNTDHSDTLAMQEAILDARATASKYMILDDTVALKVFDEAFHEYLKEKDPQLANEIF